MSDKHESAQAFHDYFIKQLKSGNLPLEDLPNLKQAYHLEQTGEAQSLPAEPSDLVKYLSLVARYNLYLAIHGKNSLETKPISDERKAVITELEHLEREKQKSDKKTPTSPITDK